MVLQLTLRASLLANILLAVSLRQFTPHSLLRQRLQRESLLRQGTALHCSNDAVSFTLKDRLLCHLPSDHTKDFHGNEITFTGRPLPLCACPCLVLTVIHRPLCSQPCN